MTARGYLLDADGSETQLPSNTNVTIKPGQHVRGIDSSGGGYGDPLERDQRRVLQDVLEGWVTQRHAEEVYGVRIRETVKGYILDEEATQSLRSLRKTSS